MTIPFWTNDPLILFNKDYIFELWPNSNMSYEQKLNAITRVIIIITILGYVLTMSLRILLVGFVTLILIFALYKMRKQAEYKYLENDYNDIRISVVNNMVNNFMQNGYIWEVYDDNDGHGKYNHPFTGWSALIVNLIYELY